MLFPAASAGRQTGVQIVRDSVGIVARRLRLALLVLVAAASAVQPLGGRAEVASGERIVFVSDRGGQFDVYLLDPNDRKNPTRVTNDAEVEQSPQLSPDGTRIVFSQDGDIWTLGFEDGVKTQRTTDDRLEVRPTWSPDGQNIAFSRQMGTSRQSNFDIVIRPLTTIPETRWDLSGDDVDPDWSSTPGLDRPIVYSSSRTGTWQLFRANPSGADQEQITSSKDPAREPAWSPDASQIAYSQWWRKGGVTLTVLDVAAEETSAVRVGDGNQDWGATWSPDGQKIAYRHRTSTRRDYVDEMYIVERSTSGWAAPVLVPSQEGNSYTPHWGRFAIDEGPTGEDPKDCGLPLCI